MNADLIAAAIWRLSSYVGRIAPRTAQRLDRLASKFDPKDLD